MILLSNTGGSLLPPALRTTGHVQVCLVLPSLLSVEISDAGLRPVLLEQQRKVPSVVWHASADSSAQLSAPGEIPFQHVAARPSSQKRRRLVLYREHRACLCWWWGASQQLFCSRGLLPAQARAIFQRATSSPQRVLAARVWWDLFLPRNQYTIPHWVINSARSTAFYEQELG